MNYEHLFADLQDRRIHIALTGAKGGFSRTLLAQCKMIPQITLSALCDLDVAGTAALLESLGFPADSHAICATPIEVTAAAASGRIALVADYRLLDGLALDIVVEATGNPEISMQIALAALRRQVHVAMVSKETDSVVGPQLFKIARDNGVVYTTADGDQPSNLIGLVTWARILGFEIVAAGKSSEYDYVFDPKSAQLTYSGQTIDVPALRDLWTLGDDVPALMKARSAAIARLPQSAVPDYCEMNVVADSTGLTPACDALSYPLCRADELADVFAPRADGGLLDRSGVVDVFNCLRRPDEASFGGGVFVVVRVKDADSWEVLRQKGHVVSRNGKYACLYLPYHIMGLETPISLFSAVLHGRPSGGMKIVRHAVMAMRTDRAFRAGERLAMGGHHHTVADVTALLLPADPQSTALAPFYLAANRTLVTDVAAGTLITPAMLDLEGSALYDLWRSPV
ncbi:NAD-binding homoserine dehydrogenase [Rhodospirillum rubrum]|uniref:Homoserine dehydrogenase, NAD-binding n=1 Tax=Rhodospirillum rubrum (strain ATCC 11170 / ATH 1.1.1 / DSM 467 / LMG 4362 / NCIMB 8255 / S1) TaxID=269796 RepID=Q2RPK9_RHORT|nr:NAD-binding homoserine dehydrogenase [Rhodospirillum rubrum]ABC23936.1 Homoserine dehydrogenase, NAD-binding [Rhodospirillum rubrum ATCC 11170]AEO49680.1 homoserine dehydrogenase, NAD-binding protein [Rhodospirillum rubrum F11]MBK5955595.1 homoserine dehydrogenase [Rhodospirillum rubrum]QXG79880.1 homoserine dehydrogenase [Rhodospirillum rubrum]HAP99324.1 homoserine dehydrogenase [Rhodospirillum rubrum]